MNDKTICINSKVGGKQPSLQDRVYSTDGCATAITTGFHPSIAEAQVMTQTSTTRRGSVQEGGDIAPTLMAGGDATCQYEGVIFKGREIKDGDGLYLGDYKDFFRGGLDGVSRALKSESSDAGVCTSYRIRKLTPRECFRLMGVSDTDIDKIQNASISNTQQFKLAGNSVVVDCLYHLFRKMFVDKGNEDKQMMLF